MSRPHLITGVLAAGFIACVPLPIPHKVTPYPHTTGRVLQADSLAPAADAQVSLEIRGATYTTTTDEAGEFDFEPHREWRYFWFLPLLPFDPACSMARVAAAGADHEACFSGLREFPVCGPTAIIGDTGQWNRDNPTSLGNIALCPAY